MMTKTKTIAASVTVTVMLTLRYIKTDNIKVINKIHVQKECSYTVKILNS